MIRPFRGECRVGDEAQNTQAIVESDNNYAQVSKYVGVLISMSEVVTASVKMNHDG